MTEIKLKPCPFCGGEKLKIDSKRTFKHGGEKHCSVTVRCMKCHARSPVVGINMPKGKYNEREICEKAVIEAWNRRTEIAELKSEISILTDANENLQDLYREEQAKVETAKQKVIDTFKKLKNAKSEAIREFAEKLKERAFDDLKYDPILTRYVVSVEDIERIVKEMTEGENG